MIQMNYADKNFSDWPGPLATAGLHAQPIDRKGKQTNRINPLTGERPRGDLAFLCSSANSTGEGAVIDDRHRQGSQPQSCTAPNFRSWWARLQACNGCVHMLDRVADKKVSGADPSAALAVRSPAGVIDERYAVPRSASRFAFGFPGSTAR